MIVKCSFLGSKSETLFLQACRSKSKRVYQPIGFGPRMRARPAKGGSFPGILNSGFMFWNLPPDFA